MQLEFDRPNGTPPAAPATGFPEPWAVALNVKARDEKFLNPEPMVATTCQFNRQFNGVRLNTPGSIERDVAKILHGPLDYTQFTPARYTMEHYFSGMKAAGRSSAGFGTLEIGPPIRKTDQRVFSSADLSSISPQDWIGALGVTLVTITGTGQIMIRLRKFVASVWP